MRNRWGVDVRVGHWVRYQTARGGVLQGKVEKIVKTGDMARAYGPRVNFVGETSCGIDDVVLSLGPRSDGSAEPGNFAANPTPNLEHWEQASQREHVGPRGGKSKKPSPRLVQRRLKTHHQKMPGVWANPLVRVKVKSPAQRGKAAPDGRLMARRKTTDKAPAGFYANPGKLKPYVSAEVMKADGGWEYGMDAVTPVRFEFTTVARERKGAYKSWKLPPSAIKNPDFQIWARENGGQVVMSLRALTAKIKAFM